MISPARVLARSARALAGDIVGSSAAGHRRREVLILTRETVTFQDANGWNWEFDLTFMLSNYRCIWGNGCPDTRLERTARGCCVEGVEVYQGDGDTDGREDLENIRERVEQLTDEDWQNRRIALRRDGPDPWGKARFQPGSVHTRLHRGACIFYNRPDHPGGAGCALHVAALRRGENPLDWKPRICWQVPLFLDTDEPAKTTIVRACRTADWGGDSIHWWCTEHADAFSAEEPVYVSMAEELRRSCGDAIYDELADYCQARERGKRMRLTPLPMLP